MDARQLQVLRELGARGSVTAVADALFITPSAVSQHLQSLQRTIPVALTERAGRRVQLTPAGHALAAAAADVELAFARARQTVEEFVDRPVGSVSVAAFHSAASTFFPRLALALGGPDAPDLSFADEDVARDDFPALTGSYDLVLAHRMDHAPEWPDSVSVTTLLHEPLDVALPASHPLTRKARVTPRDVADEQWISVHDGFPLVATMDAVGAAAGRPLHVAHRINDFTVALQVVATGRVLALAPRWTSAPPAGVALRPLVGAQPRRYVDAIYRPERLARRAIRITLKALRAEARQIAGR